MSPIEVAQLKNILSDMGDVTSYDREMLVHKLKMARIQLNNIVAIAKIQIDDENRAEEHDHE